jgi:hypothetical protein
VFHDDELVGDLEQLDMGTTRRPHRPVNSGKLFVAFGVVDAATRLAVRAFAAMHASRPAENGPWPSRVARSACRVTA